MIHLNVLSAPGAGSGDEAPGRRPRIPLRIAEVRAVKAPPVPRPIPGHLCERCFDAPAVVVVTTPEGGEIGLCQDCHQAPAVAALPVLIAEAGQQTLWHTIRDPERLAAYRAAAAVPLPTWWDRCVSTAPARVCTCGSYQLRWGEEEAM